MLFKKPSKYWTKSRKNDQIQNRDPFYYSSPNLKSEVSENQNLINLTFENKMNPDIIDIDMIKLDGDELKSSEQQSIILDEKMVQPWWEKKEGID